MKISLWRAARVVVLSCLVAAACAVAAPPSRAQRDAKRGKRPPQYGKICSDPTAPCQTNGMTFEAHDLPFRLPKNAVIFDSEEFYAVILKSVRAPAEDDCEKFIPEGERLEAQKLFARRKVFSSRCVEPGSVSYTNVAPTTRILAVYAGATRAEAERTLADVKATGKFPGANLRRMRAEINGT